MGKIFEDIKGGKRGEGIESIQEGEDSLVERKRERGGRGIERNTGRETSRDICCAQIRKGE